GHGRPHHARMPIGEPGEPPRDFWQGAELAAVGEQANRVQGRSPQADASGDLFEHRVTLAPLDQRIVEHAPELAAALVHVGEGLDRANQVLPGFGGKLEDRARVALCDGCFAHTRPFKVEAARERLATYSSARRWCSAGVSIWARVDSAERTALSTVSRMSC